MISSFFNYFGAQQRKANVNKVMRSTLLHLSCSGVPKGVKRRPLCFLLAANRNNWLLNVQFHSAYHSATDQESIFVSLGFAEEFVCISGIVDDLYLTSFGSLGFLPFLLVGECFAPHL